MKTQFTEDVNGLQLKIYPNSETEKALLKELMAGKLSSKRFKYLAESKSDQRGNLKIKLSTKNHLNHEYLANFHDNESKGFPVLLENGSNRRWLFGHRTRALLISCGLRRDGLGTLKINQLMGFEYDFFIGNLMHQGAYIHFLPPSDGKAFAIYRVMDQNNSMVFSGDTRFLGRCNTVPEFLEILRG